MINVRLYGGFAGWETKRNERDFETNVTILSADIEQDDVNIDGNNIAETSADIVGRNSYHVIRMLSGETEGKTMNTHVDGFIITGGYADAKFPVLTIDRGGGLCCMNFFEYNT